MKGASGSPKASGASMRIVRLLGCVRRRRGM
jgi:hypothetical protein